ncbi:MAG: hypothetical protein ACQ5SW_02470, partial [Sphaerochaetaceae bacterium]
MKFSGSGSCIIVLAIEEKNGQKSFKRYSYLPNYCTYFVSKQIERGMYVDFLDILDKKTQGILLSTI